MAIMVYDIETIPDLKGARALLDIPESSDEQVYQALLNQRRQQTGSEFLAHPLHKIIAISVLVVDKERVKVWSLGEEGSSEAELIERFFQGLELYTPTLVSWNGAGFDLPVL
ncbi:MAG: hypothetical protein JWM09_1234, partial [Francisellaceae bacterium]|nr:hypothetical protein [Francisellaceae bacterium]